jgi:hypothetical protein
VRDWLGANGAIPASTPIKACGKRVPVAPNTTPDGRDNPEGRQKNRRVEIVFETCRAEIRAYGTRWARDYPTWSGRGSTSALAAGSDTAFGPPLATATRAGRSMRSPIM